LRGQPAVHRRALQLQGLLGLAALLPQGQPAAPQAATAHPATKDIAIVLRIGLQVTNITEFAFLGVATEKRTFNCDTSYLATAPFTS